MINNHPHNLDDNHRLCTAPMLDWSDRHCRYLFRLFAPKAMVYTEMVSAGAILHGDRQKHLDFSKEEHPISLQLGGNSPEDLANCVKISNQWGYDEFNINCGCPSERVQNGNFGATLMLEPSLVGDCVKAMSSETDATISVKHRLGLDSANGYGFLSDFVGTISEAGCKMFVAHARIAVLSGMSPKKNREVPPLNYDYVYQLKKDFPDCSFILNGGLDQSTDYNEILTQVDGVMIGRAAYHTPEFLGTLSHQIHRCASPKIEAIVSSIHRYAQEQVEKGVYLRAITRHLLGLFHGVKGAKNWRRLLSSQTELSKNDASLILKAFDLVN